MNSIFQVLTLAWTLQGGQYFNNAMNLGDEGQKYSAFFLDYSFELQVPLSWAKGDVNNVFLSLDIENQFMKDPVQLGFDPWQDTYIFGAGIRFMGLEIGYEHVCTHPILVQTRIETSSFFQGFDKIYGKISGSF